MITLSPGLVIAIMLAIIASVPPHVTTTFSSGFVVFPVSFSCFFAMASLKFFAPQVMEYWCGPVREISCNLFNISIGGSNSGNPCAKLIELYLLATSVIFLMTDSVKLVALFDKFFILLSFVYNSVCFVSLSWKISVFVDDDFVRFHTKSNFQFFPYIFSQSFYICDVVVLFDFNRISCA